MDRSGFVSVSGCEVHLPNPLTIGSSVCFYAEESQKQAVQKASHNKGKPARAKTEDKENVAPQIQQELTSKAEGPSAKPDEVQPRKPLRDVTHLYYPTTRKIAPSSKVAGLRSMR